MPVTLWISIKATLWYDDFERIKVCAWETELSFCWICEHKTENAGDSVKSNLW